MPISPQAASQIASLFLMNPKVSGAANKLKSSQAASFINNVKAAQQRPAPKQPNHLPPGSPKKKRPAPVKTITKTVYVQAPASKPITKVPDIPAAPSPYYNIFGKQVKKSTAWIVGSITAGLTIAGITAGVIHSRRRA